MSAAPALVHRMPPQMLFPLVSGGATPASKPPILGHVIT